MQVIKKISRKILDSTLYKSIIIFFVLVSVFLTDITKGWMSPGADRIQEVLMTLAFVFLMTELLLNVLAYRFWYRKLSFWIFLFATLTLLFDLNWFINCIFVDMGSAIPIIPMRLMRLIRLVSRLGRMMRIIHVFLSNQLQTIRAIFFGSNSDRGDKLMTQKVMKRLTGKDRVRTWEKIEAIISYGIMACFLFLYVMISGLGILQMVPVSPSYLKAEVLIDTTMGEPQIRKFLNEAEDLLYLKSGETLYLDDQERIREVRSDEILKLEDPSSLILVDNSTPLRKVHRQSLYISLIFFTAMSFMTLFISWVIQKYSVEFSGVLKTLARALDERDSYTREHSVHVAVYGKALAAAMGLSWKEQDVVHLAGELHDIGKIGVPESVLHKNGPLDDEEYGIMKKHPVQGIEILDGLLNLDQVVLAAYYHHEKYNGKGYPEGLERDSIPRIARILSVCDVWDALTTDRPYRSAMSFEKAKSILQEMRGEDLPPDEVDAFFNNEVWKAL